jgi:hypothetical protein
MGGSVEATNEGIVSVVLILVTRGAIVYDTDISEEVRTVVWEGVG